MCRRDVPEACPPPPLPLFLESRLACSKSYWATSLHQPWAARPSRAVWLSMWLSVPLVPVAWGWPTHSHCCTLVSSIKSLPAHPLTLYPGSTRASASRSDKCHLLPAAVSTLSRLSSNPSACVSEPHTWHWCIRLRCARELVTAALGPARARAIPSCRQGKAGVALRQASWTGISSPECLLSASLVPTERTAQGTYWASSGRSASLRALRAGGHTLATMAVSARVQLHRGHCGFRACCQQHVSQLSRRGLCGPGADCKICYHED